MFSLKLLFTYKGLQDSVFRYAFLPLNGMREKMDSVLDEL